MQALLRKYVLLNCSLSPTFEFEHLLFGAKQLFLFFLLRFYSQVSSDSNSQSQYNTLIVLL